jgi:hypothetical protein
VDRNREAGVLLACAAVALLVLTALATNLARLGAAISREVQRAQVDYMKDMGTGDSVEHSALLLGRCLRREMLKTARAGFVHPDTWAVAARIRALPGCSNALPAVPPPTPPLITTPRIRPIIASATPPRGMARPATSVATAHAD